MDRAVIVGAGLAGLSIAVALQKVGIDYVLLEQRGELSEEGGAIGLWRNGLRALEEIGVADALRNENVRLDTVQISRENGRTLREFSVEQSGSELLGASRARLQQLLRRQVPDDRVRMSARVAEVRLEGGVLRAHLSSGERVEGRILIGADGSRSVVANALGAPPLWFAGQAGYRGIARFDASAPVAPQTVQQIWGRGTRAGLYPLSASEVYWFVCFDAEDVASKMSGTERQADALRRVDGWGGGIADCVRNTEAEAISCNRFYDRSGSSPWTLRTRCRAVLAGDALHPMTPNLGQGGCAAMEDSVVLARRLRTAWTGDDRCLQAALAEYERERMKRCWPLALRSRLIGAALQSTLPPVVALRDAAVRYAVRPSLLFGHTLFDAGRL